MARRPRSRRDRPHPHPSHRCRPHGAHAHLPLRHTHTGFVADQVVTGEIYLPNHASLIISDAPRQTTGPTLVQTFYTPLLDRMNALPGTQSTGLTTVRPLEGNWDFNMDVELTNHPKPQRSAQAHAQARATSADYFKTMGIRLLQGRLFTTTDSAQAAPTAIVNRAFVQRFLPTENPIGQQLRYNDKGDRQWATIVGVVDDSPQKTLGQPPLPEIHYNLAQLLPQDELYFLNTFFMNVAIRSPLDPGTVTAELRRVVHDLQPDAALDNVQTLQQVVDNSLGNQNFAARLLGLFCPHRRTRHRCCGHLWSAGLLSQPAHPRARASVSPWSASSAEERFSGFVLRHAVRNRSSRNRSRTRCHRHHSLQQTPRHISRLQTQQPRRPHLSLRRHPAGSLRPRRQLSSSTPRLPHRSGSRAPHRVKKLQL